MAPPRRVRDEALTLRRTGLADIELYRARESIYVHQYPTQGRFQVAANAQAIAFTTPQKDTLTIVRRDGRMASFSGVHGDQFRISPDGHHLSVARYRESSFGISRIDIRSLEEVSRDFVSSALWTEYCAEGLVVLEYRYNGSVVEKALVLLPWKGEKRELMLIDSRALRFSCAKAGETIAYFSDGRIWSIPKFGAEPILLGDGYGDVVNAEMSPDGRSFIAVTAYDAILFQDGKVASRLGIPSAHTIWFSPDGSQFVVANERRAIWQRGDKKATLEASEKAPIHTARFAPMSPWIMVARGPDAVRWNPDQNEAETIASADEGQEMLAVDVFGGGVVIWTGSTWKIEDPRRRFD